LNQTDKPSDRSSTVSGLSQQFRQLADIAGDPSRLILAEQLGGRAPPRLILEIDIRKRLSTVIAHDKAGVFCLAKMFSKKAPAFSDRG
jgi:hypothetical protein